MSTALLSLALSISLPQTPPEPVWLERRAQIMGTIARVEVEAADRATALADSQRVIEALDEAEQRLSTWREDSELSQLNRAPVRESFELSPALTADLVRSGYWVERSDGAFDPAVAALIAAWDLRGEGRWPEDAALAEARAASGWSGLELGESVLVRRRAGVGLDAGAFGKGAGLDAALAVAGAGQLLCDLGGQLAWTRPPAEPLAIADPRDRAAVVATLTPPEGRGSIATSGNSERSRVLAGGRRIGHLLDPRDGEPAEDFGSVTVWARRAIDADCLSTALFVLGPDKGLELAMAEPEAEALFALISPDDGSLRLIATPGLRDRLKAVSDQVELHFLPEPVPVSADPDPSSD